MYILWLQKEKNMENALKKTPECAILTVQGGRAVCPTCGRQTTQRIHPDTVLIQFPLYCRFCRRDAIVNTKSQSQTQSL